MSVSSDATSDEIEGVPSRTVFWKLDGKVVCESEAAYPMQQPHFETVFNLPSRAGKRVKFTLKWIWNIGLDVSPTSARGSRRRIKRNSTDAGPQTPRATSGISPPSSSKRLRRSPAWQQEDEGYTQDVASIADEGINQEAGSATDSDATDEDPVEEQSVKKKKLTARQRAMNNKSVANALDAHLLKLPMKLRSGQKTLTEAQLLKKSENARKRRLAILKQDEERKLTTIEKLLTKTGKRDHRRKSQKVKAVTDTRHAKFARSSSNVLYRCHYTDKEKRDQIAVKVSFPKTLNFNESFWNTGRSISELNSIIKNRPICANLNCSQLRRYSCKKNSLPVCHQLTCYNIVSKISCDTNSQRS
mmetsp:Transcript_33327/g.54166  ORF Transcript_33327/g.54166 Transcript_33327/m.54166 type:complete len:359 (+) Transcript_33327:209-1285(+)